MTAEVHIRGQKDNEERQAQIVAVNLNIHKTINLGYFACVNLVTSDSLHPRGL